MEKQWHAQSAQAVMEALGTGERGLSAEEARVRLATYGPNRLPEAKMDGIFVMFLRQFQSPLIYILLAAAAAVFVMGETGDGAIILGVLLFNAIVGTVQEGKAQNTLRALRTFAETTATVVRDGAELIIPDDEVVPGDIIVLAEGEKVPADARIIEANNLKLDEAALTGESEPVHKLPDALAAGATDISPRNMAAKATNVAAGNGRGVVVATGRHTAIGAIAAKIQGIDTDIPLKAAIRGLSKAIIVAVGCICAGLFALGIAKGLPAREMFGIVVSLAVSVVPEGLPIVVTLILAMGVWRMGRRNALVKKLQAVEALGQARVIAVDKTGTITKNELIVRTVLAGGRRFEISGDGYEPKGEVRLDGDIVDAANHADLLFAGKVAAYAATARVMYAEEERRWRVAGDPTEAALLVLSEKLGFHKADLLGEEPVIAEMPFDYRLKYHAVTYGREKRTMIAVGAPEAILSLCAKVRRDGRHHPLEAAERAELEESMAALSRDGLRVIAFAEKTDAPREIAPETLGGLAFAGFYGMRDTLRAEVAQAVEKARAAGIRVFMITGDHKITARAIAREAGIWREGDTVLTGAEVDVMPHADLVARLATTSVFARFDPDHKMAVIKAFRARGEVVAMTGDGVNDAPPLVAADLGVAMGITGTEVAKEAADIVLLDDDFNSIVAAVEEGRSIYKTIKKVILYLFSTSAGEVLSIAGAIALGMPAPVLAAQIIWLNFVTDGFLDVSLAMEPKERGLLRGRFEKPRKYLVDGLMLRRMIFMAVPMAVGTLVLFSLRYEAGLEKAWTLSLTLLAAFQWFNAWNCRSDERSVFSMNPFSNIYLVGATALVIGLQLMAVYAPFMHSFLHTVPLDRSDWLTIVPIASSIVFVEEIRKFFARGARRRREGK